MSLIKNYRYLPNLYFSDYIFANKYLGSGIRSSLIVNINCLFFLPIKKTKIRDLNYVWVGSSTLAVRTGIH